MGDVARQKSCFQIFAEEPGIFVAIKIISPYFWWNFEFAKLNLKIKWRFAVHELVVIVNPLLNVFDVETVLFFKLQFKLNPAKVVWEVFCLNSYCIIGWSIIFLFPVCQKSKDSHEIFILSGKSTF